MAESWLFLTCRLPRRQDEERIEVWKRLRSAGAVPVGAAFVLPDTPAAVETMDWIRADVVAAGGEAVLLRSALAGGLDDVGLQGRFRQARAADWRQLLVEVEALRPDDQADFRERVAGLRRRAAELTAIDWFKAPGSTESMAALERLERGLPIRPAVPIPRNLPSPSAVQGMIWTTAPGIGLDAIACAWLLRRLLDPGARIVFGIGVLEAGTLRFAVPGGDFPRQGGSCAFTALLAWSGLADPALQVIEQIVADLERSDGRYRRPEAIGVACAIAGIQAGLQRDEARLERGMLLLDSLYAGVPGRRGG